MAAENIVTPAQVDPEDAKSVPMRSHVVKGPFMIPEGNYEEGERAFIEHADSQRAKTVVTIASEGQWNKVTQQIEYRLKLADGTWYKDGMWIQEKDLNSRPKTPEATK